MKKFHQKVDMNDRKAMVAFLKHHFRYDVASHSNKSDSYANNLKIYELGLTKEQETKLLDIMDCEGAYDKIDARLEDFGKYHKWQWQARFNGRSGGYLVLYQGGWNPSDYKSYCTECGQYNFKTVEESGCHCGKCGKETRVNFGEPMRRTFIYPCRGTDMYESFDDWSEEELKERVKLVQNFDLLCEAVVETALEMIDSMTVEEKTVMVPVTKKVLREAVEC